MATKKEFNYQEARKELQDLLDWFESGSAELDKALDNYKRAEELISQVEAYLRAIDAKLQVTLKSSNS
jgi:exodeoxyribonuclease VII small subunit